MFIIVICAQNLTRWCITADIVATAQRPPVLVFALIRGQNIGAGIVALLAVLPLPPKSGNK